MHTLDLGIYQSTLASVFWQITTNRDVFAGATRSLRFLTAFRAYRKWRRDRNPVPRRQDVRCGGAGPVFLGTQWSCQCFRDWCIHVSRRVPLDSLEHATAARRKKKRAERAACRQTKGPRLLPRSSRNWLTALDRMHRKFGPLLWTEFSQMNSINEFSHMNSV